MAPKLGRPVKDPEQLKQVKEIQYRDECFRNAVEGRFGVGNRRYHLDKIMTKLKGTSKTMIALIFRVMNLERILCWLLSYGKNLFGKDIYWVTAIKTRS